MGTRQSTLASSSNFSHKGFVSCLSQRFSSVVAKQTRLWLSRSFLQLLLSTSQLLAKIARSRLTLRIGWGLTKLVVLRFLLKREKLRWTTPWRHALQWSVSRFSQACAASSLGQTRAGSSLTRSPTWSQNSRFSELYTFLEFSNFQSCKLTLLLEVQRHLWFRLVI